MLTIEKNFLSDNATTLQIEKANGLIADIKALSRQSLEKQLQLGTLITEGKKWFKSKEGRKALQESGLAWSMDDFLMKAYGLSKSWASRLSSAAHVPAEKQAEFKRKVTQAIKDGKPVSESVEELIAFGKGKGQFMNEASSTRAKKQLAKASRLGSITVNVVNGKVELATSGKVDMDDLLALINRSVAGADTAELLAKIAAKQDAE